MKDLLDKARRWLTYWIMRGALKLHEEAFIMMCKMCVMDTMMRENGVARLVLEEDEDGNTRFRAIYHNTTRH